MVRGNTAAGKDMRADMSVEACYAVTDQDPVAGCGCIYKRVRKGKYEILSECEIQHG